LLIRRAHNFVILTDFKDKATQRNTHERQATHQDTKTRAQDAFIPLTHTDTHTY